MPVGITLLGHTEVTQLPDSQFFRMKLHPSVSPQREHHPTIQSTPQSPPRSHSPTPLTQTGEELPLSNPIGLH
ncbi:uncharacterized protein K441DRAFT_652668 [Cenococcum geophilum 1.58]|uniref:uncharacterized protein n=1 Tax=Cenococcum geophilum 1.58 TaxID=794803 RepID=UPI00358ED11F|nr:hypothetical protein K441DRAFT_652668 [Cenococcum geophilum 1.58]